MYQYVIIIILREKERVRACVCVCVCVCVLSCTIEVAKLSHETLKSRTLVQPSQLARGQFFDPFIRPVKKRLIGLDVQCM